MKHHLDEVAQKLRLIEEDVNLSQLVTNKSSIKVAKYSNVGVIPEIVDG